VLLGVDLEAGQGLSEMSKRSEHQHDRARYRGQQEQGPLQALSIGLLD